MPTSPAYLSINLGVNELGRLLHPVLSISWGHVNCVRWRKGQVRIDMWYCGKTSAKLLNASIVSTEDAELIIKINVADKVCF